MREIPDIFRAALFQDQGQPRGKFRNDDVVFFFGGCSGVGGEFFHTLGSGWHEGVGFPPDSVIGAAKNPDFIGIPGEE